MTCWVCDRDADMTDVLDFEWCQVCWDQADEDAVRMRREPEWW